MAAAFSFFCYAFRVNFSPPSRGPHATCGSALLAPSFFALAVALRRSSHFKRGRPTLSSCKLHRESSRKARESWDKEN